MTFEVKVEKLPDGREVARVEHDKPSKKAKKEVEFNPKEDA